MCTPNLAISKELIGTENVQYPANQYTCVSVTGLRHRAAQAPNDDVTWIEEKSGIRFYGLADGQSGKTHCKQGGLAVLRTLCDYVADVGIAELEQCEYPDELRYSIITRIRDCIAQLSAAEQVDRSQFSSTLILFAHDVLSNRFACIHLGDGAIFAQRAEGDITIISAPDNGLLPNYTWLTTSQDALAHVRFKFGSMDSYRRILLFTDGADVIANGKNMSAATQSFVKTGSREELAALLEGSSPADDASCIILDV